MVKTIWISAIKTLGLGFFRGETLQDKNRTTNAFIDRLNILKIP